MPNLFATHTALFSVANIGVWGGTGFNMIVIYTALRSMPTELYEAARIDGASQVQIALRIKIPMISPALVLTGVFSIIATLQVFNEPQTLAPLTNTISPDWMPLMKIYDLAFNDNNAYAAAALSVVVAAGMFVLSYGLLRLSNKYVFQGR
jgi:multiple sugar transport system permease protein